MVWNEDESKFIFFSKWSVPAKEVRVGDITVNFLPGESCTLGCTLMFVKAQFSCRELMIKECVEAYHGIKEKQEVK